MLTRETLQECAAWFHVLLPDQQERVMQSVTETRYPGGAMIERKGGRAEACVGVRPGLVKVSVGNADGTLASLTGVPAGGWIGEGSLLKDDHRKYDVVALRDATIVRLSAPTFRWLLD